MEALDIKALLQGNRRVLAKAITLVESTREADTVAAKHLLSQVHSQSGRSIRLGISGVPGVGKSTFIEVLGMKLIEAGHRVAVLAVDPSSPHTRGSILGDRTRMVRLSAHSEAFIRPSPSGGRLGGVARATRDAITLCEAAGFDRILVETVGVGQSEYEVASMTDLFVLLALTGAGDHLQGIKRGILEIVDILVINKADGDNREKAMILAQEYVSALHLLHPEFDTPVLLTSATEGQGFEPFLTVVNNEIEQRQVQGLFEDRRKRQRVEAFKKALENEILRVYWQNPQMSAYFATMASQIETGERSFQEALQSMLAHFKNVDL
jgi:LAO/AO transport system kinase